MRARISTKLFSLVLLGGVLSPCSASAHVLNYIAITTVLTADAKVIHFSTEVPATFRNSMLRNDVQVTFFQNYFSQGFSLLYEGKSCPVTVETVQVNPAVPKTLITGRFDCTEPIIFAGDIGMVVSLWSDMFTSFDHYVSFVDKETRADVIFNQDVIQAKFPGKTRAAVEYAMAHQDEIIANNQPQNIFAFLKQFIVLGIMHILNGFDHILFLIAVVLVVPSLRRILIIVTAFTLAHSITLILSGLHIVVLSPYIVEPLIALSIVYMAIDDIRILRKTGAVPFKIGPRFAGAFGFGLVHGLGFAGALTDMKIPGAYFVPAIVTFNIGIELGQMSILALVLPVLKFSERLTWRKKLLIGSSAAIGLLASYWFIVRVFFS